MFVGKGFLALVPSHLPYLKELSLVKCDNVCDKYVAELVAAVPELEVINRHGKNVGTMRNKQLETTC